MSARDYRIEAWDRSVETIVRDLRSLADRIEREGQPYGSPRLTGTGRFTSAAEDVQHALAWGIANLGAYRLIETAFHADAAEREGTR